MSSVGLSWGRSVFGLAGLASLLAIAGCSGSSADSSEETAPTRRPVVITTQPVETIRVERAIEVVGTLKGWEETTVGSKQPGRVVEVLHDIGDRVEPDEELVRLDDTDAELMIQQSESQLLGELVKLGIDRAQAEQYVEEYGISEDVINDPKILEIIKQVPAVKQAELQRDKADLDLNRQRQLTQRNAATLQELQDAQNAQAISEAAYQNAIVSAKAIIANALVTRSAINKVRQELADMIIRVPRPSAPPLGFSSADKVTYAVTKRDVSEGQMLRVGDPVMDLVLDDPVRLWANVPERYFSEIAAGQDVELTVASFPGEIFEGQLTRINPAVDPISRTFQVEAVLRNPDRRLRPGSFAKARILTRTDENVSVVPLGAVVRTSGVVKLFLYEPQPADGPPKQDGIAREVRVETGVEANGMVEIIGGLPANAQVVVSGQTQLADLWPVVIRQIEDEPASESNQSNAEPSLPDPAKPVTEVELAPAPEANPLESQQTPEPSPEAAPAESENP